MSEPQPIPLYKRAALGHAACAVLLLALPIALWLPGALRGDVPMNLGGALFAAPWEEARPAGLEPSVAALDDAYVRRYYPWYRLMNDTGRIPFWNPREGVGAPFMALWRTRALSPFSLPVYFLPLPLALGLSVILKGVVAGWCAYFTARRFGLSAVSALFVGLTYQCTGPLLLAPCHPMADTAPWLPLLLPCAEGLFHGKMRSWTLGAMVVGLMALGGDPGNLAGGVFFAFVYLLAKRVRHKQWTNFGMDTLGLLIATSVGLMLAGPQIFPFFNVMGEDIAVEHLPPVHFGLHDLTAAFSPVLIAADRRDVMPFPAFVFMGIVPLLSLALWAALRAYAMAEVRRRVESLFLASFFLCSLAYLFSGLWDRLPGPVWLRPEHLLTTQTFAFSFLAAAAFEEWNLLEAEPCKAVLRRLAVFAPLVWLPLFGMAAFLTLARPEAYPAGAGILIVPLLAAVALAGLLVFTLFSPSIPFGGVLLAAIALAALLIPSWPLLPHTAAADIFPETTFIKSLREMGGRVGGSKGVARWPLAGNGLEQPGAPSGTCLSLSRRALESAAVLPDMQRQMGASALVLTKEDIRGPWASLRPSLLIRRVYPSGAVLCKDPDSQPRARVIYRGRSIAPGAEIPPFKRGLPLLEGLTLPADGPDRLGEALILPDTPFEVVHVVVSQTPPGVLVLADAWQSGWSAKLDGKTVEVGKVEHVFRGVEIGAGEHEVVFRYQAPGFRAGLYAAAVAACFVAVGLIRALLEYTRGGE